MKIKLKDIDIENKDYAKALMASRGVDDLDHFLNPTEKDLQHWSSLDNIKDGIDMLFKTLNKDKSDILLIIDCDMDGFCSAAIAYQCIERLKPGANIDYICHENKQHGLEDISKRVFFGNYDLVVIPDAGSNDGDVCAEYPAVDFLILDHHEVDREFNLSNMIVINNQMSKDYKNKQLCGAGVTWQFFRAVDDYYLLDIAKDYIDLVAFATVADMMDITVIENRYILQEGIKNINNYFLRKIVDKQSFSLKGEVTPIGIAFYIAPLINAMNRVGTTKEKENMFIAFIDGKRQIECNKRGAKGTTEEAAIESARECVNAKARQGRLQEQMSEAVNNKIVQQNLLENKVLIIELDKSFDDIPNEINGLAANKIANQYNRPTLIGRVNNQGEMKGSIRNVPTVDMPPLKDFLMDSGLFDWVQGHASAAGFCFKREKLDRFHDWANNQLAHIDMNDDVWEVEFSLSAKNQSNEIMDLIYDMEKLKPTWGQNNKEPYIHIKDILINKSDINIIGKGDTVKITYNGIIYMFFRCSEEKIKKLQQYENIGLDIVGTMNINEFNGTTSPQIFVSSFEVRNSYLDF